MTSRTSPTVLDVTGKPLAKATVAVDGTPVGAVVTGTDGRYTLPKVAEGSYTLSVTPARPGPVQRRPPRRAGRHRRPDEGRPGPVPLRRPRQQLRPGRVLLDQRYDQGRPER
ncbi:carboxypeptidase regulatory-like domain-containing protein [Streptomyces sp. NPDC058664]|uniref:carboxypeptidase regulatory-like domain-containing protein n=1 Tax=unclassified Streptomyces TaxID=2593676 RepID=UPI00365BB451